MASELLKQNRLRWDLTPEDINTKAEELIKQCKAVYDAVGSLKKDALNYENTLQVKFLSESGPLIYFALTSFSVYFRHSKILFTTELGSNL